MDFPETPPLTIEQPPMAKVCIILTETERDALLRELELEKFKTPDQFALTDEQKEAQREAVEAIHRRFHYVVAKYLS